MTDEPGVEDRLQIGPVQAALLAQAAMPGELGLRKGRGAGVGGEGPAAVRGS
ncbi:hypothetical protein [Streptomyces sp. LUP47B]|uniref:hypothetical protein n=1 Tax=Streptomyces sp. LUP47B TaxID=1890286 RepID=UPI00159F09A1|nr:hypothetical protein [Streptomyces sp. LUP47B]